jgi:hypothetical protein
MMTVRSLSILHSLYTLFTGLMASLSGGITGGMILIITPTGTIPGGTGIGNTIGVMIIRGIHGTPGFIAGFTGTTGGIGLLGGLSNSTKQLLLTLN